MKHDKLIINSEGKTGKRPRLTGVTGTTGPILRRRLDYHGIARKVFHVEQLPPGALPYYDKDIDIGSCIVDKVAEAFRKGFESFIGTGNKEE
jgi:hypothetical protein